MKHNFSKEAEDYLCVYMDIVRQMIRDMTAAPQSCSISQNFIRQMIPHHRGAIEMSENILRDTENSTLRQIAQGIVAEQTQSIETMRRIEPTCAQFCNPRKARIAYTRGMDRIMRTMFSQMTHAPRSGRVDCDFLSEMIPHHRGAVRMSALTLRCGICPELTPVLETIISSQRKGISEMQQLQCRLRCHLAHRRA